MAKRKRIILVTELFYPEESATAHVLTRIANGLSDQFDILVITGPESYENDVTRLTSNDLKQGIEIQRVWVPGLRKDNLAFRTIRFIILSIGLGLVTFFKSRNKDVVFAVTNPAPLLVVLAFVRKFKRFKFVLLVHDVFPENAVAVGLVRKGRFFYPLIERSFNWAYSASDSIIAIGRDMAEVISRKTYRREQTLTVIENWADTPLIDVLPRDKSNIIPWGLGEKIVIHYAGNIGRAQGIMEFVDVVSSVDNEAVHYVFSGSGALKKELTDRVNGLASFTLEGAYSRTDQALVLGSCDIALIILGAGMYGLGVPSKTYNILAAGKPILFLGPKNSEIYCLIKEHSIGWAFDWNETKEMVMLLNSLSVTQLDAFSELGKRARLLAECRYSEPTQIGKFRNFFELL